MTKGKKTKEAAKDTTATETTSAEFPTDAVASETPARNHDMVIREINLDGPTEAVMHLVKQEKDLMVLQQALAQEGAKGARKAVINTIITQAESLRDMGAGSEDLTGLADALVPFDTITKATPNVVMQHDMGKGSTSVQTLTEEQRLTRKMTIKEAEHRCNDYAALSEVVETRNNGVKVFSWGHIFPPQKEVKDKTEKGKEYIAIPGKKSMVFLKYCPKCGRQNRPETATVAQCYHCNFDFMTHIKKMAATYPDRFAGLEL